MVQDQNIARVDCSDKRNNMLRETLGEAIEIRIPGGPRIITDPDSREFGLGKLALLHKKYHFVEIQLVFHGEHCADYANAGCTFADHEEEFLFYQQEQALAKSIMQAHSVFQGVPITTHFASKEVDGYFTEVIPFDNETLADTNIMSLMFPQVAEARR